MDSFYSNKNYESINSILDGFSSDIFDGITLAMRPVVGGVDYLRSMHKAYLFQKELQKVSNWSFETREIFLDAMTDVISGKAIDDDFQSELDDRIAELDEINETFKHLNQLARGLDQRHLPVIYRFSLNKLNGRIISIKDEINSRMWDKEENINQLLVLDQVFYLIQELINEALKKRFDSLDSSLWGLLLYSLLYVEAFHRNKVTFEDLQDFISDLNLSGYKEDQTIKNYDTVFEVLAV